MNDNNRYEVINFFDFYKDKLSDFNLYKFDDYLTNLGFIIAYRYDDNLADGWERIPMWVYKYDNDDLIHIYLDNNSLSWKLEFFWDNMRHAFCENFKNSNDLLEFIN